MVKASKAAKLGKVVKLVRESRKMTQSELAKKLETDRMVITQIENGHRGVSFDRLAEIASKLGVPVSILHVLADDEPNDLVAKIQLMAKRALGIEVEKPAGDSEIADRKERRATEARRQKEPVTAK